MNVKAAVLFVVFASCFLFMLYKLINKVKITSCKIVKKTKKGSKQRIWGNCMALGGLIFLSKESGVRIFLFSHLHGK